MNAAVVREYGSLAYEQVPDPQPPPGWVVVELRAAAVNRRDLGVVAGRYADFELPLIPGSDGAGVRRDTGEEVVILPSVAWGDGEDAPGREFRILGGDDDGTYAELVAVPAGNVFPRPRRLPWHEAAALPLAGLTAYRALHTRARVRAGETVLVPGAGSGVATFLLQLARQAGARVWVTSSSEEKLARARELGAERGVDYTREDWQDEVKGADVVIDSTGLWADALGCLRPGGRLVVFGATAAAEVQLDARPFYLSQFSLLGTTMGSPREFAALLRAVEEGGWSPVVDSVRPLTEVAQAHARMQRGEQFGKLVLEVS